jgi:hypothetical protein
MEKTKRVFIYLSAMAIGLFLLIWSSSANAQKPNILFIMGDDIG